VRYIIGYTLRDLVFIYVSVFSDLKVCRVYTSNVKVKVASAQVPSKTRTCAVYLCVSIPRDMCSIKIRRLPEATAL